ncbi:hypothetical protein [Streptomyces sp. NPDC057910]|uniref:hypothetical protein n=1 Tax=Streptomyces sp. NPDC057910 TaxID=3346278 RepID=UPI0036E5D5F2
MTTGDVAGTELTGQAQDLWEIIGPALQDSNGQPDLPARTYQALQTWPAQHIPDELWTDILALLPLEDQTRLAHTSHHTEGILERLAPQALDPTAHTTTGFIRTIYTQTELDTRLNENPELAFIPGTGSDLTIGQGRAGLYGGTLAAVTGGHLSALRHAHITTVADGQLSAYGQAAIGALTGGNVFAHNQATITTVTGGVISAYDEATITTVTCGDVDAGDQATITTVTGGEVSVGSEVTIHTVSGGNVTALDQATIEEMTGGIVTAEDEATITTVTGGTVTADGNATITTVSGDAHIVARSNAQVFIEAGADGVHVDAYDAAHITAHSGTITIHSPDVTITSSSDGNASSAMPDAAQTQHRDQETDTR